MFEDFKDCQDVVEIDYAKKSLILKKGNRIKYRIEKKNKFNKEESHREKRNIHKGITIMSSLLMYWHLQVLKKWIEAIEDEKKSLKTKLGIW